MNSKRVKTKPKQIHFPEDVKKRVDTLKKTLEGLNIKYREVTYGDENVTNCEIRIGNTPLVICGKAGIMLGKPMETFPILDTTDKALVERAKHLNKAREKYNRKVSKVSKENNLPFELAAAVCKLGIQMREKELIGDDLLVVRKLKEYIDTTSNIPDDILKAYDGFVGTVHANAWTVANTVLSMKDKRLIGDYIKGKCA